MTRTFKAEFQKLRAIARSEGRDPYRPAGPFVSVGERYRLAKLPKQPPLSASMVADIWAEVMARAPKEPAWTQAAFLRAMR